MLTEISKLQANNLFLFCVNIFILQTISASGNTITQKKNRQKNVLFISVDDLKPDLGCYGNTIIKTPNIDRIAERGTVFLNNYCQQAVSGPTRASLMTGKRPDYTQVWDLKTKMRDINPNIVSIPQYFAQNGYKTLGIGKIYDFRCVDEHSDKPSWTVPFYKTDKSYFHNSQRPLYGFYQDPLTYIAGMNNWEKALKNGLSEERLIQYMESENEIALDKIKYAGSQMPAYLKNYLRPSVECIDLPDNAYLDGAQTLKVQKILSELTNSSEPFFFAVGFHRPHLPFAVPKKYWDMYDRNQMPIAQFQEHAKNSPEIAYTNSGELLSYSDIPPLSDFSDHKGNYIRLPIEKQAELIHGYYASVSYIDAQIGRIITTLDSLGMSENTIIVLWGDHGWHLGDHDLWCKHTNFEHATRAPLIISAPGFQSGSTTSMTEFVDIFPTLCDLASLPEPKSLDGISLVPVLKNKEKEIKKYSISQYPRKDGNIMGYSLRTKKYRFTCWFKNEFRSNKPFSNDFMIGKELYDYEKDPLETKNVIGDRDYSSTIKKMEKKLMDFFKSQLSKF